MISIKRGYVHLMNVATDTLTLSDTEFDTIQSGVGSHLEKALRKLSDNHSRRRGVFKPNSVLKEQLERFAVTRSGFEELSYDIAKRIFEVKAKEVIDEDATILFILEGHDAIYGLEMKRGNCFVINRRHEDGKQVNEIYNEGLTLPSIRADGVRFFEIDLETMNVNILEKLVETKDDVIHFYADLVFQADMDDSINQYLSYAREAFYNVMKKSRFKTLEDVKLKNKLEEEMDVQIKIWGQLDFIQVAKKVFINDYQKQSRLVELSKDYGLNKKIKALSQAPIKVDKVEYSPKRVVLKNGVQVLVPDDIEEVTISLKEVDGKFKIDGEEQ